MSGAVDRWRPDGRLHGVLGIMQTARGRRVPVVDESGHLWGAITLTDIARYATREHLGGLPILSSHDVCLTLARTGSARHEPEHLLLAPAPPS